MFVLEEIVASYDARFLMLDIMVCLIQDYVSMTEVSMSMRLDLHISRGLMSLMWWDVESNEKKDHMM
jgi:hypothetical protein